ncbi:MAG: FtsQ-type POTRA domain-containing protein [Candidatus Solibacter usitatus]|nr:FtsQ-type POTRA domain-containing protein [Candidatus Solibacter usitatus]
MSRRTAVQDVEFPLLDTSVQEQTGLTRRRSREAERTRGRWKTWFTPALLLLALFTGIILFQRLEAFLISDERFHLKPISDARTEPAGLSIQGLRYADKAKVMKVLENDIGKSIYLFPLADRRRGLLAVDWVKAVTISRRWPDRIQINLTERNPVAYAKLPGNDESTFEFRLIDADGVLLPFPNGAQFPDFAVLTGLEGMSGVDKEGERRKRVGEADFMRSELGTFMKDVSEVDVRDHLNLQVTMKARGDVVYLKLGHKNYRQRVENFLKNYPDIHQAKPEANRFDLRIDTQITALESVGGE